MAYLGSLFLANNFAIEYLYELRYPRDFQDPRYGR
jgi:hypothetical protein